jgi:NitT/TauT family transport system permease protein
MLLVIVGYDRLMFRPLVAWSEKFRFGQSAPGIEPQSWLLALARRTRLLRFLLRPLGDGLRFVATRRLFARVRAPATLSAAWSSQWLDRAWITTLVAGTGYLLWSIGRLVGTELDWQDAAQALLLGVITMSRVIVLIGFATLLWVPIGVRVGLDPQLAEKAQPLAQLLAAFPANIAFPFVVHLIVHLRIDPDIWLSPLMILGTQWYILFNVIAGASVFPRDLQEAAASFRVRGWKRWRKVLLPGIFPYYVTGAITASGGGCWNASIVAEAASWGDTKVTAHGIGAYIAEATAAGDYPRVILGIAVMSLFVILFNRLLWRPLFAFAARRLRID